MNLLTPRAKVTEEWPHCPYFEGQILIQVIDGEDVYYTDGIAHRETESTVNAFPKYFRILEWWEGRDVRVLPKYVKDCIAGRVVIEVHKWEEDGFISKANAQCGYVGQANLFVPATEEEYNDYKNRI